MQKNNALLNLKQLKNLPWNYDFTFQVLRSKCQISSPPPPPIYKLLKTFDST